MAVESDPVKEPPACSVCGTEMELSGEGTMKTIPVIGSEVEFQLFNCPNCGQGVRFERSDPDGEWSRPVE